MKKTLMIAALGLMALAAKAQSDNYNRVYIGYAPIMATDDDIWDETFHGLNIGYTKGISLNGNAPLYLEVGANVQFNMYTEKEYDYAHDLTLTMLQAQIPVNITYLFPLGDSGITLAPYAGLSAKFNILGKEKLENPDNGNSHEMDYFSKDDMGDFAAKRFQVGMQLGANITFGENWNLGIGYQRDLTSFMEADSHKLMFHGIVATVGFNF